MLVCIKTNPELHRHHLVFSTLEELYNYKTIKISANLAGVQIKLNKETTVMFLTNSSSRLVTFLLLYYIFKAVFEI